MENFLASAQRIMRNKNFVTIAGIIIVLILLYWGYSTQINNAVQPISVPVATSTIQPRTEITSNMVEMVQMPKIVADKQNVIKSRDYVVGKYSNINTVIPAHSMFYTDSVIDKEKLPDAAFVKVKKGEIVYNFRVNIESTFGNAIMPGNKIDIYMKTGNGSKEKIMIGKLVENIEVLAVKDSSGRDVFENTSETRTPSMMIFGLPTKVYYILKKAAYLNSLGVELYPIPHGGTIDTSGATEVSTQQLVDYIEAHAIDIPITEKETNDTLKPTISQTGNVVSVKFPKGCGYTYTCTYTDSTGKILTAKAASKSKKVTKKVTFVQSGTITATLSEEDGTEHTITEEIKIESTTNSAANQNANSANTAVTG